MIVAQDKILIEQHARQAGDQWLLTDHLTPGSLELNSIKTTAKITDLYERVTF